MVKLQAGARGSRKVRLRAKWELKRILTAVDDLGLVDSPDHRLLLGLTIGLHNARFSQSAADLPAHPEFVGVVLCTRNHIRVKPAVEAGARDSI